jgi:hypothetical protein
MLASTRQVCQPLFVPPKIRKAYEEILEEFGLSERQLRFAEPRLRRMSLKDIKSLCRVYEIARDESDENFAEAFDGTVFKPLLGHDTADWMQNEEFCAELSKKHTSGSREEKKRQAAIRRRILRLYVNHVPAGQIAARMCMSQTRVESILARLLNRGDSSAREAEEQQPSAGKDVASKEKKQACSRIRPLFIPHARLTSGSDPTKGSCGSIEQAYAYGDESERERIEILGAFALTGLVKLGAELRRINGTQPKPDNPDKTIEHEHAPKRASVRGGADDSSSGGMAVPPDIFSPGGMQITQERSNDGLHVSVGG